VIVRVVDGSVLHRNFSRWFGHQPVAWGRGRHADERVMVLRSQFRGSRAASQLVDAALAELRAAARQGISASRNARRSAASSERAVKPAKSSSPAHAA